MGFVFSMLLGVFCFANSALAAWQSEQLENDYSISGQDNAIALTSGGDPVILYDYNGTEGDESVYKLKVATKDADGWNFETVVNTTEENIGWSADLVLDADDQPHIAYLYKENWPDEEAGDYTVSLKYAYKTNDGWEYETVATYSNASDRPATGTVSLELDSNGNPAIAYTGVGDSYQTKYAYKLNDVWQTESIEADLNCEDADMVFDSIDLPHIVMACRDNYETISGVNYHDAVLYSTYKNGGVWEAYETVDANEDLTSSGYDYYKHLSLTINEDNQLFVLYHDMLNRNLMYADNTSGAWAAEFVDDSFYAEDVSPINVYFKNSIALDNSGYPYVAYYNFYVKSLMIAHKYPDGWHFQFMFSVPWKNEGGLPSMTFDTANTPHISYIGMNVTEEYAVRYAYFSLPSVFATLESEDITHLSELNNETIVTEGHSYFTKGFAMSYLTLPSKLQESRYYIRSAKIAKYPEHYGISHSKIFKKYWRVTSNLNTYVPSTEDETYSLRLMFSYKPAELKAIKRHGVRENQLKLKYFDRTSQTWVEVADAEHDSARNLFYVTLDSYTYPTKTLFTIGK